MQTGGVHIMQHVPLKAWKIFDFEVSHCEETHVYHVTPDMDKIFSLPHDLLISNSLYYG